MTTDAAEGPALEIPELCLVVLIGASGSGKSSFARRLFAATEVISSDVCRGLVSDDESDQGATGDAFELVRFLAGKRLARRRLTVIDATSVSPESRASLLALAKAHHVLPVAIVLDVPPTVCVHRNKERADRRFGGHVVRRQYSALRRSLRGLKREGFRRVHRLRGADEVASATIVRARLWNDRRDARGPFDIIGDVHGCHDELVELLGALGYAVSGDPDQDPVVTPPEGRAAIFVGDLVDRGPASPRALRLVMNMVARGQALCVSGNHEAKLVRWLQGKRVKPSHGLDRTIEQLEREPAAFRDRVREFAQGLISHFVLDDGRLVVAHAGLREELHGRTSGAVRAFAMYGETKGETDSFGLPVRYNWARDYRGRATVVYGHTPIPEARWLNNTICVDTGCVFGGKLTALRYPERELVSVPARAVHYPPARPLADVGSGFDRDDDLLDLADVVGRRTVDTRALGPITLRPEQSVAALETISRFTVDPHWLVYLPPTMSPPAACPEGELLERPREAFEYYRARGVQTVVCQEKHMGSRAVII
ncbi:MAG: polynucleotide kinase-phosphatase, partial [Myxococcales bacterium]|nr:polynucleotide kinase-phosphatase [Myxococcales bacterium]